MVIHPKEIPSTVCTSSVVDNFCITRIVGRVFSPRRRYGIGGDGVIFALPGSNGMEYTMRIINSDGSEVTLFGLKQICYLPV